MRRILLLDDLDIGPADFAAWRDEIEHCVCVPCVDANRFRPLDYSGRERLVTCVVLLDVLKAGRHVHVSYAQAAATARARAIVNGTYGRPVIRVSLAFAQTGIGAGMTPGGVR